jgi:hypothetical protein
LNANDGNGNVNIWTFSADGNLSIPGGLAIYPTPASMGSTTIEQFANTTLTVQAVDVGGILNLNWMENPNTASNINQIIFNDPLSSGNLSIYTGDLGGTYYRWGFEKDGNLTLPGNTFAVNYANGTQVSLGGGSYGNSDVATFLASYGSNTITTTGNISGGNLLASANVLGNGYARFTGSFDESQASTAGLYVGYAGGTPRIMFGTGNTSQTFEIDNDGGNLRFYQPGNTKATLTSAGDFSVSGNITAGNLIGSLANGNSKVSIATANGNVAISAVGNTTMTITGIGANITGIANITGNVIAGSNSTTGFILGNVNSRVGVLGSNAYITMSQNIVVNPDQ